MLQCSNVTCSALRAVLPSARRVGDAGDQPITGLTHHSRQVSAGCCFFALSGAKTDGADFAADAFAAGAPMIIAEREVAVPAGKELLIVASARQAMAECAIACSRELLGSLTLVGVTGTNGKTTTTHMVRAIMQQAGHKAAAIGTTGIVGPDGMLTRLENTTPDILFLLQLFHDLAATDCRHIALEVSSQGVVQRRVAGLPFRVGVFTNLTPEHMETHGDYESYREAKLTYFREAGPAALRFGRPFIGVVYADDPEAALFADACPGPPFMYGSSLRCDVRASDVDIAIEGSRFFLSAPSFSCNRWVDLPLPGRHNILNALAAAAVGFALGMSPTTIAEGLAAVESVPGRLERVAGASRQVYIDYAHSSDALQKLLESCREMAVHTKGRLIVVFGCGGDRDRTKRPRMGRTAVDIADQCYVTSDNPRTEEPQAIIDDILGGISEEQQSRCVVIVDRKRAIEEAIRQAGSNDIVVIAGKGHEDYQILGTEVIDFDDRQEARRVLQELDHGDVL